jgi:transposase InsO family protein
MIAQVRQEYPRLSMRRLCMLLGVGRSWYYERSTTPTQVGNPFENATAESFFKTLKCEEVYLQQYETLAEAEANLDRFIRDVYNVKRLHSSVGYLPPVEFAAQGAVTTGDARTADS